MGQTARDIHAGLALSWPAGLPRGGQSDYFPFRLNENAGLTPQDGSMGGGTAALAKQQSLTLHGSWRAARKPPISSWRQAAHSRGRGQDPGRQGAPS